MILTVSGPIDSIAGTILFGEHVMKTGDHSAEGLFSFSLDRLWSIRKEPLKSKENFRFDSVRDITKELSFFKDAGGAVVVDTTSSNQRPHLKRLLEVSERSCISIVLALHISLDPLKSLCDLVSSYCEALLVGSMVDDTRIPAGVIAINYIERSDAADGSVTLQSNEDTFMKKLLIGVEVQQKCFETCNSRPPILLILNNNKTDVEIAVKKAIDVISVKCSDSLNSLVLCGCHSFMDLQWQLSLLEMGVCLCFSSFGTVHCDAPMQDAPSDYENAERLLVLAQHYPDKLTVSHGISQRLHLTVGGGCGFSHLNISITPLLRSRGMSDSVIEQIFAENAKRLLDWYAPPRAKEGKKIFMKCSWCGSDFEPIEGEYFSKYKFVYCGTTCLRAHRDMGFTDVESS